MKRTAWNKQELITALLPLVQECNQYHCFGSTSYGMTDSFSFSKTVCQCAGEDQNKHLANQIKKMNTIKRMCAIVKEITNKDVYRVPSTYSDFYFREHDNDEIIIGIGYKGEITEPRSYA